MSEPMPMTSTEFRIYVRNWLEVNCPPAMRRPARDEEIVWGGRNERFRNPEAKVWLERMVAQGWTCPTWPKSYGGASLSAEENKILQQELRAIGARPALMSYGISMLGPVLLEFGNDMQNAVTGR